MSNQQNKPQVHEGTDTKNIFVDVGDGKKVPLSSINKPHQVVIDPKFDKPKIDPKDFPQVESNLEERTKDINK